MDIKQQIKEYLNKKNTTLTNVVSIINSFKSKEEQTTVQNINNKLTRGTIKYSEVLEIAQILGYDIIWQEQKPHEVNLSAFNIEYIPPSNYPTQVYNYDNRIKEKSQNDFLEQQIQKFYSNLLYLLTNHEFPYNLEEYIKRNLGVATISFNTIPLYSFIFGHTTFLCEALSYTDFGNDFIPTLTYLQNIYYQGRLDDYNKMSNITLLIHLIFLILFILIMIILNKKTSKFTASLTYFIQLLY
jgi:hypothetical protein